MRHPSLPTTVAVLAVCFCCCCCRYVAAEEEVIVIDLKRAMTCIQKAMRECANCTICMVRPAIENVTEGRPQLKDQALGKLQACREQFIVDINAVLEDVDQACEGQTVSQEAFCHSRLYTRFTQLAIAGRAFSTALRSQVLLALVEKLQLDLSRLGNVIKYAEAYFDQAMKASRQCVRENQFEVATT